MQLASRTHLLVVLAVVVAFAALPLFTRRVGGTSSEATGSASFVQDPGQWIKFGGPFRAMPPLPDTFQSGRVSSIAVDPRDPSRWLLGVGNGGVWETRDAGGTWTPIADDAPTLAIGAVAFAPSNPDIIYVATGENVGSAVLALGSAPGLKNQSHAYPTGLLIDTNYRASGCRRSTSAAPCARACATPLK